MKLLEIATMSRTDATKDEWLHQQNIENYKINPDGTISATGHVQLVNSVTKIPVRWKRVSGSFYCNGTEITSLEGAPQVVGSNFFCNGTDITSLAGGPQTVGGDFNCHGTKITSLIGAPEYVGGCFYCYNTKITSLIGAPQKIGSDFICSDTKIRSLHGIDKLISEIGGTFACNSGLTHILGLIYIKKLQAVHIEERGHPLNIIMNKYLGTGDILSCQDELLDAGFKTQAQL